MDCWFPILPGYYSRMVNYYLVAVLLICLTQAAAVVVQTRAGTLGTWLSAVVAMLFLSTIGSMAAVIAFPLVPLLICATLFTTWVVTLACLSLFPIFAISILVVTFVPLYFLTNNIWPPSYDNWFGRPLTVPITISASIASFLCLFIVYWIEYMHRHRKEESSERMLLVNREQLEPQPCPTHIHRHVFDFDSPSRHPLRLMIVAGYALFSGISYAVCLLIVLECHLTFHRSLDWWGGRLGGRFDLLPILIFSPPLLAVFNSWHVHKILVLIRPGWSCSCVRVNAFYPPRQQTTPDPIVPDQAVTAVGVPSAAFTTKDRDYRPRGTGPFQLKHITSRLYTPWTETSSSIRSYTPIQVLCDGSFSTISLSDWHLPLPPATPVPAMQFGPGSRPEWTGKRLVCIKLIKREFHGGWNECKAIKELQSLRAIPHHHNVITLYDFFYAPESKRLCFVFEPMEGNLSQFLKARRGHRFSGRLVFSVCHQIVSGLDHIHSSGYFHHDMKPENVLITTTGAVDYPPLPSTSYSGSRDERDVAVVAKICDLGLTRSTGDTSPYTEYVSTRWYRAPEVLLNARDYSTPVDMWAVGTIMAEVFNLRPLFPGTSQIDQLSRICNALGDPSDHGVDTRGKPVGGGPWSRGIALAEAVGFRFPECQPQDPYDSLCDRGAPASLVDCISDLLKYDPCLRSTARQCLQHPYFKS